MSDTTNKMTKEEFSYVTDTICVSFDIEVSKIKDLKRINEIIDSFMSMYHTQNLYSFFVLSNLKKLASDTSSNATIRDIILNTTESVMVKLTLEGFDWDKVTYGLADGVVKNKVNYSSSNYSLLAKEINESLFINRDTLRSCLDDNRWLSVLYILIMFFQSTQTYSSLLELNTTN
jgi:hypothetical protein